MNKKIYRMGKGVRGGNTNNASTSADLTDKTITPMGGFPHYGIVRDDFLMVKGCIVGPKKKVVMLRRPLFPQTKRVATESVDLKFIDTSSKMGHGRFQSADEKAKYFGKLAAK